MATRIKKNRVWRCLYPLIGFDRETGRKMEAYYDGNGLWRCRPAKGDSEREEWVRWDKSVLWPREWLVLPIDNGNLFEMEGDAP